MKNLMVTAAVVLFSSFNANASSKNIDEILDSKIVSNIFEGIEAEYQVKCSGFNFTITDTTFIIDGACRGTDKWEDEYAAMVSIRGTLSGDWVIVENMTIQLIP